MRGLIRNKKILLTYALLLCAPALLAQSADSGSSSATDCGNPMNATSAACSGGGANAGADMSQTTAQPTYGAGATAGAPVNGLPTPGLNQRVPNYVDRSPNGLYRNGYPYGAYGTQYFQPLMPTEFQKVVAGSVGKMLPIYGEDLFANVPTTFAPVDRVPVTPEYVIGPGDEVLIRVWGQVSFNVRGTVDRSGDLYIPQVGAVHLAGLQFSQLNSYLHSQLSHYFRNFDLNANMGQLRSIQIFVVGQAQRPGSYTVSSLSTLVNALFASGGPSVHVSMRAIQVKRGDAVVTTFDLYDLLLHGDKSKDVQLVSGDVIYIPPVGPRVAIAGSVQVPAIYELKGTETAGDAIQLAGGFSSMAAHTQAQLDRVDAAGNRATVDLPLDAAGLQTVLRNGDILRVLEMVQQFDKTVTLRGNVANPGRYAWHPGMTIHDLIPDKQALITRNYWQERIALGLPAPEYTPLYSDYPQPVRRGLQTPYGTQAPYLAGPSSVTDYGLNSGLEPQAETGNAQPQYDQQGNPIAAGAGESAAGGGNGTTSASASQPGNSTGTGTAPLSSTQASMRSQQNNPAYLIGAPALGGSETAAESASALARQFLPGDRFSQGRFPVKNEIIRTAPDIDWSYAVIERTNPKTLTSSLVPFDLGKAVLQDDPSQNLPLQPNDVVTVFSTADIRVPQEQQTKYVELEGEFVHAGLYSLEPGETLRHLVARAGGLTPQAYLYGSELLRESTRRLQQARLDAYVTEVEHDIQESASNAANTSVNATAATALSTSVQSQRELIATLRKLHASGRIVLNLNPNSAGVDALPDLPLEDGDRFVVPVLPTTVSVIGAAYNQSSFLYQRGGRVGRYLQLAGGATRNGDKRNEFVIHADGSVLSKQYAKGTLFGDGFDHRHVHPGDTIVVPDNVNKTTLLRGLTDWSQVLSGFGLGIASLTLFGL
jgi:protein involved in polysaccharide export with SLBB domain